MIEKQYFLRFNIWQRIEHAVLVLSFATLALTGLPQKFPLVSISQGSISVLGGIQTIRIIHRVAATLFMLETIYHVVELGYKLFVKKLEATMAPSLADLKNAVQAFLYNIGLSKMQPKMGRYNFVEKAEYWAMVWGMVIMALSGYMLWNPIATSKLLPGQFIPAAKVAHGGEAILAVLAILVWHFYNVHLKKWNWSMINGKISREEMEHEHALELETLDQGIEKPAESPRAVQRRLSLYAPLAAVFSVVFLYGIYLFVSFEDTAILTVPPGESAPVFSEQTPTPTGRLPEATAIGSSPTSGQTWNTGIGELFTSRCGTCHGSSGGVTLDSYSALMRGKDGTPVLVPGNSASSPMITLQQKGDHPGLFSPEELTRVIEWIDVGAPE